MPLAQKLHWIPTNGYLHSTGGTDTAEGKQGQPDYLS